MHTSISKKNDVARMIEEHLSLFNSFIHVYLFGSSLKPQAFSNDIDLLVIYSDYSEKVSSALKTIAVKLEMVSGLPIHLTALSEEEEQDTGFLARLKPYYIELK